VEEEALEVEILEEETEAAALVEACQVAVVLPAVGNLINKWIPLPARKLIKEQNRTLTHIGSFVSKKNNSSTSVEALSRRKNSTSTSVEALSRRKNSISTSVEALSRKKTVLPRAWKP
jgi:hypothetical protein